MEDKSLEKVEDTYSWNTYDEVFKTFLIAMKPARIMDIGAGSGKYGKLVRQLLPDSHITAIEIDVEGVERNQLRKVYDQVATMQTIDFLMTSPKENFDLVIIGDCIEHMLKSTGIDLLNYLNYRSAYVLVITPDGMVMNLEPYFLGHISNWTERDFMWHDNFAVERVGVMQLFLMRGLLRPDMPSLAQFADHVKALQIPLHHDNGSFAKHAELVLKNQMVTWSTEPGTMWSYRPF